MEISNIYIYKYICMYSFFYGMLRLHTCLRITVTAIDGQHISSVRSSPDYVEEKETN